MRKIYKAPRISIKVLILKETIKINEKYQKTRISSFFLLALNQQIFLFLKMVYNRVYLSSVLMLSNDIGPIPLLAASFNPREIL